ncbi:hypothetical protein HYALB_00002847 [Hymenoscyphus albidus]|uniref:Uncharacterized protein n=1 Tax=Hymenoscyphus albidus TaxID=595503 RepID=A0A9N9LL70_9HELO|nr:hypothetical protein HYALB_00002847 [Hymenoscyphus albidus]
MQFFSTLALALFAGSAMAACKPEGVCKCSSGSHTPGNDKTGRCTQIEITNGQYKWCFMERPRDGNAILEHKSVVIRLREASRASTYAVLHMTSSPPATTVKLSNWFANVNINTALLKYNVF